MSHVMVSAAGKDRPGIVAAVTQVLLERGCNLEDTAMGILRGHFGMLLVVDVGDQTAEELEAALRAAADAFNLVVTVRPIDDEVAEPAPGDAWTVSVYGADHPGIVHGVASLLASCGVNIVDLSTRVIGEPAQPVYAMVLDVIVPPEVEVDDLRLRMAALAADLGVDCTLHPADADIL